MTLAIFTALYIAQQTAQAAFDADPSSFDALHALDAADKAFYGAVAEARALWNALPEGDAKFDAETNACETEGCEIDDLKWLEVALASYEIMVVEYARDAERAADRAARGW